MDSSIVNNIRKDLQALADQEKAKVLQRFFKTGPGQYAEGDIFLGVIVPESRKVAKKYSGNIALEEVRRLLGSDIHEERLIALLILVEKFRNAIGNKDEKNKIAKFYLDNLEGVNNWDLVDLSAPSILGSYLIQEEKDKSILYKFAGSSNVWERRVSIIATLRFIKNNQFDDTLKIAEILLCDDHGLIQKAVGWMLREIGKRDIDAEEAFLKKHYRSMPRTTLRYAIERFPENKRQKYMVKEPVNIRT